MRARALATLAAMILTGCATVTPAPVSQRLPYIAVLRPPPGGEKTILLTAAFEARIRIDHECVLIGNDRAGYSLPLFYRGTAVGRDAQGLYLEDAENRIRFRDGERVLGGGGGSPFTGNELDRLLMQPVPDICLQRAQGIAGSINPGMRRPGMQRE